MDIRSTLTELCASFNAHDLDRIMAWFSDDCVLEMPRGSEPWGSRFEGKRNVRDALSTRFEALAGCPLRQRRSISWIRLPIPASRNGPSQAPPARMTKVGGPRGGDFYTFRDGKVVRKDSYWKIVE